MSGVAQYLDGLDQYKMPEMQSTLPLGTIIRGLYIVEEVLGSSTCGAVYLVRDAREKQNLFALKEMINPGRRDRYLYTFDPVVLEQLEHPALPRVYTVFNTHKQNRAYILMEYIKGPNLEIVRLKQPAKCFSLPQVMTFMAPIADAVIYLHSQQPPIIHGHIKPLNIIVPNASDESVLVDLGIAGEYDATIPDQHGASGYKAPEQYRGEADPRTDIYALGSIFYTLLTGTIPVDASYRLMQLDNKQPDPLVPIHRIIPAIPVPIAMCIHRAMCIDSNNRFPTVKQFWYSLNTYAKTREAAPLQIPAKESPPLRARPPVQRIPKPAAASEQFSASPAKPPVPETPEPVPEVEEVPFLSPAPQVELTPEPILGVAEAPTLVVNPMAQETLEYVAAVEEAPTEVEELPTLPFGPIPQQPSEPLSAPEPARTLNTERIPEPAIASATAVSEEASSPVGAALPKPATARRPKVPRKVILILAGSHRLEPVAIPRPKIPRKVILILAALLIMLFISAGVGASLWFYTTSQHPSISTLPPSTPQRGRTSPPSTASPSPTATSTPIPVPSPNIATQYTGTLHDIPTGLTTNISLTGVRQQQGNITGYFDGMPENTIFNGIPQNGPFMGTVNTAKQIQFIVTSNSGQATFSFNSVIQPDGTIGGTYCNLGEATGKCSDYGIWSLSPAA